MKSDFKKDIAHLIQQRDDENSGQPGRAALQVYFLRDAEACQGAAGDMGPGGDMWRRPLFKGLSLRWKEEAALRRDDICDL